MIVPMYTYGFLVHHADYARFLDDIQQLGVLHIMEKEHAVSDTISQKISLISRIEKTIQFLEKQETRPDYQTECMDALVITERTEQKQELLEALTQELNDSRKELQKAIPWGDFSTALIRKLEEEDIHVRFFAVSKEKFTRKFQRRYHAELISESHHQVYFISIQQGKEVFDIEAYEIIPPEQSVPELEIQIRELEKKRKELHDELDSIASWSLPLLRDEKERILTSLEFEQVSLQTRKELNNRMMVLEGWVPITKKEQLDRYLAETNILFTAAKASPKDKAPVLLQNGRFSRLFEPIGRIFSLPDYCELDLTVFFAPFFMLFFGFCLGDAGYGFLFVLGAGLYKLKAPANFKPYLTLVQYLGAATILFGVVSGTLFGVNLIETDIHLTENIRDLFLKPEAMFNLALLLGAVQIIFGLCVKAANQMKQFGFTYGLGTLGWLFIILGSLTYGVLVNQQVFAENKLILSGILIFGGFFILFFSDPEAGVFMRIGKGVWDVYSTVTGIFGDLLSYIRLFAIGLSSSILGYVINDIALTILHAAPVIGPVIFVLFLLLGHTLNIMISTLGSFVHPMRLTFVEFYKNAGFTGGGREYKPFLKYSNK